jgi:hypothetical protein
LAGLFLGLSILASPGSAYGGAIISTIFFIKFLIQELKRKTLQSSLWLLLTGLVGLLVSAPYWLTIIQHREIGGFTSAFLTQQNATAFLNQIRYMITFKPADMITFVGDEGVYGFLFDWLVFGGLIWTLLNKQTSRVLIFFALWIIPREGCWLVAIPAAGLAASGIIYLVLPMLHSAFKTEGVNNRPPLAPGLLAMILVLMVVSGAINALHDLQNQPDLNINSVEIETLKQEQKIIPTDAHILIAGNYALREWTPALLQREVLNCEFGLEWQPSELKRVNLINRALEKNDLVTAMAVIHDYSGDNSIWLIGNPEQVIELIANAGPSLEVTIKNQTPELIFAFIHTGLSSWTNRLSWSNLP